MASSRVVNSPFAHHLVARGSTTSPSSAASTSFDHDDPEEESIRLAIALQLEDLEGAPPEDEEAVFEVYRGYLEESERFLADRRLAEELAAKQEPSLMELMENVLKTEARLNRLLKAKEMGKIDDDDDDGGSEYKSFGEDADVDGGSEYESYVEDVDVELDEQIKLACELSLKYFEEEKRRSEVCSTAWNGSVLPVLACSSPRHCVC